MKELGLKIDVSGVEQAIEALNRLEAAAIAAQKAVSAVDYAQKVHSGEAILPSNGDLGALLRMHSSDAFTLSMKDIQHRMERTLAKWDSVGTPARKE